MTFYQKVFAIGFLAACLFLWNRCERGEVVLAQREQLTVRTTTGTEKLVLATSGGEPLPTVQHLPTPENPFIFYHLCKTGGSTIRDVIYKSALDLSQQGVFPSSQVFIPCYQPKSCREPGPNWRKGGPFRILAGHFQWGQFDVFLSAQANSPIINSTSLHQKHSCFIMVRHPVERLESCYYFNLFKRIGSSLAKFSVEEFKTLFSLSRCNNEILLRMGGCGTNQMLNASRESPLGEVLYNLSVEHMGHCVVGLLERWEETVMVVNHWFPWLKHLKIETEKMNVAKNKPIAKASQLRTSRPDLVQVAEELNYWELKAYEHAVVLFEKQLRAMKERGRKGTEVR